MLFFPRRYRALILALVLAHPLLATLPGQDDDDFTALDPQRTRLVDEFGCLSEFPGQGWHSFQKDGDIFQAASLLGAFLPETWGKDLRIDFSLEDLLRPYDDQQIRRLMENGKCQGCLNLREQGQIFWKKRAAFLVEKSREGYISSISWNHFIFPPEFYYGITAYPMVILKDAALTMLPKLPPCEVIVDLDLSDNFFDSFPPALQSLPNLQNLNLHNNQVRTFPPWIKMFTHLETLRLSRNKLTDVSADLGSLPALHNLDVSHNEIVTLSPQLMAAPLRQLTLSHNQLETLPDTINDLAFLHVLDVSHNVVSRLPLTLGQLGCLQELNLSWNVLTSLSMGALHLKNLRSLNVAHNRLSTLPEELWGLGTLKNLNLSHNFLHDISPNLGCLDALSALNISHNYLPLVPEKVATSACLMHLFVNNNLFSFEHISPLVLLHPSLQKVTSDQLEPGGQRRYLILEVDYEGPKRRLIRLSEVPEITEADQMT